MPILSSRIKSLHLDLSVASVIPVVSETSFCVRFSPSFSAYKYSDVAATDTGESPEVNSFAFARSAILIAFV